MQLFVIGATGFLGLATVAELLERKTRVFATVCRDRGTRLPAGVEHERLDVLDFAALKSAMDRVRPEVVINLAGLLTGLCACEPYKATQVNVMGAANVLEAARLAGARRVVQASSAGVAAPERIDTREEAGISSAVTLYGATKFYDEVLGREYHKNYGLEVVSLRYSLLYGPGEVASHGNALRLKTVESCVLGADVCIDDARAEDRVHLLHVQDAAHATALAATCARPLNGVYNISGLPGDFLSFQEIVDMLHAAYPHAGKVRFSGKKPPQQFGLYFHAKAKNDFGYLPAINAQRGLIANAEQRLAAQAASD